MDWDITFEPLDGLAVVRTRGPFSIDGHRRMVADIVGRKEWRPGHPILFDNRQLDLREAHFAEMVQARDNHAAEDARIGRARSALLVDPGADYGIMRQWEAVAEGTVAAKVAVFTSEDDARAWLRTGQT